MPSTTTSACTTAPFLPLTTWGMLFHFGAARRARILALPAAPLLAVLLFHPNRSVSVLTRRSLGRHLTTTGVADSYLDRRRLRTFARSLVLPGFCPHDLQHLDLAIVLAVEDEPAAVRQSLRPDGRVRAVDDVGRPEPFDVHDVHLVGIGAAGVERDPAPVGSSARPDVKPRMPGQVDGARAVAVHHHDLRIGQRPFARPFPQKP